MFLANRLKQDENEILFDANVIKFTGILIDKINSHTVL